MSPSGVLRRPTRGLHSSSRREQEAMRIHRFNLVVLSLMVPLATGCTERELPTAPLDAALHLSGETTLAVSDANALASIAALIDDVIALEIAGLLNNGQSRALQNHLENAQRHMKAARYAPAHAQLQAFQTQVHNFVANNVLTAAHALPLLDRIRSLLDAKPTFVECIDTAEVEQLLWDSRKDEEARPWIRVDVVVSEPMYVSESVIAYARLTDTDRPILGAYVQVDMYPPVGDCLAVQLLDDGWGIDQRAADGTYSAVMPPPELEGTYRFLATITGVDDTGKPFSRAKVVVRFAATGLDSGPY
jgi:hypothetical protein